MTSDAHSSSTPHDAARSDSAARSGSADLAGNPLAQPSALPFGLPDFAAIRPEHFRPAFAAGIAEQREILRAVAADESAPTFANTVDPLERGSELLSRTARVFFHLASADGTAELMEIEAEIVPQLAALHDEALLDERIFARVDALAAAPGELAPEQARMLELLHRSCVLGGARLTGSDRERLAELNQQLAGLETQFAQAVKEDMKAASVHVPGPEAATALAGLDAGQLSAARTAAEDAGRDGFLLTLTLPTVQRLLSSLEDRTTRERLYRASAERGTATWELAARIAQLRARKAQLLGFADFASLAVADRTAGRPEAVEELLAQIGPAARRNADREAEVIAARAARDGVQELAPWDWPFYEEQVRAEEHAVDEAQLRPYFVLDRVLEEGVFRAAREVYGLEFEARPDLVGHHELARIWEVREESGESVGLFVGDYFTRDAKRGGAWMNSLVMQSRADGTKPVVANTMNVSRPAPGEPAFVTLDEVRTMFHEFGHALHALLSDVDHPSVSGTSVPRDVVEFPSQVNEMWALRPGIVEHYARHVETGEPIPAELLERVREAAQWGEGFATLEHVAAVVLDWRWHRIGADEQVADLRAFEAEQLEQAGLAHPLVAPRYRTGYFNHTFSGGYAAGYYSYLWAEVFDADAVAWFEERLAQGASVRETGEELRRGLLALGGSRDLAAAYRELRGREREVRHLLARRGLD